MKRKVFFAIVWFFAAFGPAVGDEFPNSCFSGETTYFHCVGDGGVALLCGRDDELGLYLQYRFASADGGGEQHIPEKIDDSAMGTTFHYTYVENEKAMFGRAEVWLRTRDRTYQLNHISRFDHEGRMMPSESAVLMWDGLPNGAPGVMKCSNATAGLDLEYAEPLIKGIAASGYPWQEQP